MKSKSRRITGVVIVVIGALILLDNFFGGSDFWSFIWKLWPLALIVLGVYIIKNRRSVRGDSDAEDNASENRLFGDLEISLSGEEINGQHFSTLIGDIRIDLTGAEFKAGENRISVFSLVGDIRVKIPEGIPVRLSSWFLIGDIRFDNLRRDGFFQKLDHADDDFGSSDKRLHLSVDGIIGDLNISRIRIDDVN